MLFLDTRTGLALGMPAEPVDKPKRMNAARLLGDTSAPGKPQTASQVVNRVSDTRTRTGVVCCNFITRWSGGPGPLRPGRPPACPHHCPSSEVSLLDLSAKPLPQRPSPTVQARPSCERHRGSAFRDPGEGGAGDPRGWGEGWVLQDHRHTVTPSWELTPCPGLPGGRSQQLPDTPLAPEPHVCK